MLFARCVKRYFERNSSKLLRNNYTIIKKNLERTFRLLQSKCRRDEKEEKKANNCTRNNANIYRYTANFTV